MRAILIGILLYVFSHGKKEIVSILKSCNSLVEIMRTKVNDL
jgi:hypothetical protein